MRHVRQAILFTLTVSCGGTEAPSSTGAPATDASDGSIAPGSGTISPPAVHRPQSKSCSTERPATGPLGLDGACSKDADCTAGANGRCVSGPSFTATCSYDECTSDADCGAGVCDCRNGARYSANVCFRGNCTTDGDCGVNGFCSPSATHLFSNCRSNVPAGSFGYFCRTATDACSADSDCGEQAWCVFTPDAKRWQCLPRVCTRSAAP